MNRLGTMTRTDGYVSLAFSPRGARRDSAGRQARLAFVTLDPRAVVGLAARYRRRPRRRRVHASEGASDYDVIPGTISGGDLFRVESATAIAVAVLVFVRPGRVAYLLAFIVAASALGAVLLYTNVDVGAIGPLPDLYEPVWFTEKTVSAIAEAVAAVTAALGFVFEVLRRRGT
jgi:hypothetical protein